MSSSTLTRTNSKNTKYKDYVSFLQSYKSGTKDDHNSDSSSANFSLNNSSNNSSSSILSDHSESQIKMRNKLQETLKNLKNHPQNNGKTYNSGKHEITNKVKTEMVIQINSPPEKLATHTFEVKNINGHTEEPLLTVSHASRIFENNDQQATHQVISKKNSIGEMTKRFENSNISRNHAPQTTTKGVAKKSNSITEVSKIFQNEKPKDDSTLKKFNNFNTTPKAFTPSNIKSNGIKPPITSPKPEIEPPIFFRTQISVHHKPSSSSSTVSSLSSLSTSPSPPHSLSPTPPMMCSPGLRVGSPPPLIITSATPEPNIPPPPLFKDIINVDVPPPPPPMDNFNSSMVRNTSNVPAPPPLPKQIANNYSTNVSASTNQSTDLVDGKNGTINKNDPRVKRAVYGALRNMYGAYHDQANDYIATLPKNRVKKNNKLDGIIESIASQGGLDKVTGRANPKSNRDE